MAPNMSMFSLVPLLIALGAALGHAGPENLLHVRNQADKEHGNMQSPSARKVAMHPSLLDGLEERLVEEYPFETHTAVQTALKDALRDAAAVEGIAMQDDCDRDYSSACPVGTQIQALSGKAADQGSGLDRMVG